MISAPVDHEGTKSTKGAVRALLIVFALITTMAGQQPAPPRFQASVELTSIDVNVVDDRGRPIANLVPADFVVRVDGQARRVVSAEWVSSGNAGDVKAAPLVPEGYSTNDAAAGGRLIVIAVDQLNLHASRTLEITKTAGAFIDGVSPTDRVAVVGFGAKSTPFTTDRELLKQTLSRLVGQMRPRLFWRWLEHPAIRGPRDRERQHHRSGSGGQPRMLRGHASAGVVRAVPGSDRAGLRPHRRGCAARVRRGGSPDAGPADRPARSARTKDAYRHLGGLRCRAGRRRVCRGVDAARRRISREPVCCPVRR